MSDREENRSEVKDSGRRIARRFALWEHAKSALELMEAEGDRDAAARLRREMDALRPFWSKPGVTKEQAVAAYIQAEGPPPPG